eukprot:457356-Pyramimonas_sp.AAC.1
MPSPTYPPVKPWIAARQALNPDLASDPEIPVTQIAQVAVGKTMGLASDPGIPVTQIAQVAVGK